MACWLAARSARWRRLRGSSLTSLARAARASCPASSLSSAVPDPARPARAAASSSACFAGDQGLEVGAAAEDRQVLVGPHVRGGHGAHLDRLAEGIHRGGDQPVALPAILVARAARDRADRGGGQGPGAGQVVQVAARLPRLVLQRRGRQAERLGRLGLPALGHEDTSARSLASEWSPARKTGTSGFSRVRRLQCSTDL